jgi:hypothetical protein
MIITNENNDYTIQILNQIKSSIEKNIKDAERLSILPYSNKQVIDVLSRNLDMDNGVQILQDRNVLTYFISGILNVMDEFSGAYVFTENNENYSIDSMDNSYNFREQDWYKTLSEGKKEWIILSPHYPKQK